MTEGANVVVFEAHQPQRPLVDLIRVLQNLSELGRRLDDEYQPTSMNGGPSSKRCAHVPLTRAEILQTRADLEAQRALLHSIQRSVAMTGGLRIGRVGFWHGATENGP